MILAKLIELDESWSRQWMLWVAEKPWRILVARVWARSGLWVLFLWMHYPMVFWLDTSAPYQFFFHLSFTRWWLASIWMIAFGISLLIAHVVSRKRPFVQNPEMKPLISTTWLHWSFPSKHMVIGSTLLCVVLAFTLFQYGVIGAATFISREPLQWFLLSGVPFLILIGLGVARVGVRVHYFGDIIAGFIIGVLSVTSVVQLFW